MEKIEHKLTVWEVKYGYIGWKTKNDEIYGKIFPKRKFTIDLQGKRLTNRKADFKRRRVSVGPANMKKFKKNNVLLITRKSPGTVIIKRK